MNIKRILASFVITLGVVAVVLGVSTAFFSDTETSTGNVLGAGSIDLQVGSEYTSEYNGEGEVAVQNLNNKALFSFEDLKPGDRGQIDFTWVTTSNPYWACARGEVTYQDENSRLDPELEAGDSTTNAVGPLGGGELQNYLSFLFYGDLDDDQVYTPGTDPVIVGPATVSAISAAGWQSLNDSANKYMTYLTTNGPLQPGDDYHLMGMYCFGTFTEVSNGVYECNPALNANDAQSDMVEGSVEFYAVQSRNNEDFTCDSLNGEVLGIETGDGWAPVSGNTWVAKARFGDNNPTAGAYELEVGYGPGSRDEGNHGWTDNTTEGFTLSFDGSSTATLTVGNDTVTYSVTSANGSIGLTAKSHTDGTTTVSNLALDGNPLATSTVVSTGGTYAHIVISGSDLTDGFTLTGDITFDWDANTQDERPAVQINVEDL